MLALHPRTERGWALVRAPVPHDLCSSDTWILASGKATKEERSLQRQKAASEKPAETRVFYYPVPV